MKETIQLILKGMSMGVAEVIPGVSGGTLAFITGIYERLLSCINAFNPSLIVTYKKEGFKGVWTQVDGFFLIKLLLGMAIGFLIGLKIIVGLLASHPVHIWSFFFGLIIASAPLIARQVNKWRWLEVFYLLVGFVLVYWITIAAPSQGSDHLVIVFFSGILGVSALLLPGLSGSFVLLLLGMYTIIMPAIQRFTQHPFGPELWIVLIFGLGMIVGLFTFSKVLGYTFKKYPNPTLALLTGFLLGSLNKVWPWQQVLSMRINSKGEEVIQFSQSVLPQTFDNLSSNPIYGTNPYLFESMGLMVLAVVLIFILDKFSPSS
jgi:putative membrane protein